MKGIVTVEKELGIIEEPLLTIISNGPTKKQLPQQWRQELKFLKRKYSLLGQLLRFSLMHCKTEQQKKEGEDLLREYSLFMNSELPEFEIRYKEYYELFECFELLSESASDTVPNPFPRLLQYWNDLQLRNQQLELKLLHSFIKRFPVIIY